MAGQFTSQGFGVFERLGGLNFEFRANPKLHDLIQRRGSVGRLPKDGGGAVQGEESRIPGGHDHHFAVQTACRHPRIPRHKKPAHRINSHTRASGRKVRRATGTRLTNSKAEWNAARTSSSSSAKNKTLARRERAASPGATGSIRFSGPCASK